MSVIIEHSDCTNPVAVIKNETKKKKNEFHFARATPSSDSST